MIGKAKERLKKINIPNALITALIVTVAYLIVSKFLYPLPNLKNSLLFTYVVIIVIIVQLFSIKKKEKQKEDFFNDK